MRDNHSRPRPYWHVDAKWICGLKLVGTLSLTLLVVSLLLATAEKPAVDGLNPVLAPGYGRSRLDDSRVIAQARQQLSQSGSAWPIPETNIAFRWEEMTRPSLLTIGPYLLGQVAGPLYRQGVPGLLEVGEPVTTQQRLAQGTGLLDLLNAGARRLLQRLLLPLAAVDLLLLVGLIYFSHGWGRLISPGVVGLAASLPGMALLALLARVPPARLPGLNAGVMGMLGYLLSSLVPRVAPEAARPYQLTLLASLGLLVVGVGGWVVSRVARSARAG